MNLMVWLIMALGAMQVAGGEPYGIYRHGSVVRMRMSDCMILHHGFMSTMGGGQLPMIPDACPEYTLVSEKVVYVIVGKSSSQLIPLADVIDFRLHGNELIVRVDDGKHETKFNIREMVLRSEWDLLQKHITEQLTSPPPVPDFSHRNPE